MPGTTGGDVEEVIGVAEGGLARAKGFYWNRANGDWERDEGRSVIERAAIASAARTASFNTADLVNPGGSHLLSELDITAVSGTTPTLDIQITARHPVATSTYRRLANAGGTATNFPQATSVSEDDHIHLGPSVTDKSTGTDRHYSVVLPLVYRYEVTIGGSSPSFTFSVGEAWSL